LVYRLLSSPEKWLKAEYKKLREAQKQVKRLVLSHVISSSILQYCLCIFLL